MSKALVKTRDSEGSLVRNLWADFPGGELVQKGITDLRQHTDLSAEAALVLIATTRLKQGGIDLPSIDLPQGRSAESVLFENLQNSNPETAYGNYRSLKATLDSFIRCLENQKSPTNLESPR